MSLEATVGAEVGGGVEEPTGLATVDPDGDGWLVGAGDTVAEGETNAEGPTLAPHALTKKASSAIEPVQPRRLADIRSWSWLPARLPSPSR